MGNVELTLFTKVGGPLTKRITLENGSVASDGSACSMAEGTAERVMVADAAGLAALMLQLNSRQALSFGTLRRGLPNTVQIRSRARINGTACLGLENPIARTKENIVYEPDKPAWALIDFDRKGMPPAVSQTIHDLGGLWPALVSVLPLLGRIERVARASTSAGLYRTDTGERLSGSGGVHLALLAQDGSDAERFLKALHARCWLAGFGWLMVGSAGQLLERSIVDRMVGSPEHLVFEAAPIVEPPLAQDLRTRRPIPFDGEAIDTAAACQPLSAQEETRLGEMLAQATAVLAPDIAKARRAYDTEQTKRIVERTGMPTETAARIIERQRNGVLLPDIELQFDDPDLAGSTVRDVLNYPDKYVGETLADPIEGVTYGRCKAKIMRRDDGLLRIHSFAHGGGTYELRQDSAEDPDRLVVHIIGGRLPHVIDAAERALAKSDAEIFEARIGPIYIGTEIPPKNHYAPYSRRTMIAYETAHLADHWTRHVDFQKFDGRTSKWRSVDCPAQVAASYLQRKGRRNLRQLRAVISAPTLRPDGSILDKPGYDEETGLFYDPCGTQYPPVPLHPSFDDGRKALALLIEPIRLFPFVPDDPRQPTISASRSVTLSGILTAPIRAALATAPLHSSTAPIAGSGKSMLDNIIAIISTGRSCHPVAETTSTEEFEKRVATALIKAQPIIGLDNCTVPLGGGLLCQALTETMIDIRDFGFLKDISVENTALILANGNNLVLQGDITCRALRAQLDPKVERPELRHFDFQPLKMVAQQRPQLLVAALTILRTYHVAGRPSQGLEPLGSFEDWSDWPRSALVWLGQPDPCITMAAARETDPNLKRLRALLNAWHPLFPAAATLKRVVEEARSHTRDNSELQTKRAGLLEAIEAVALERGEINTRVLGTWLASHKGRVIDGLRFEEAGTSQNAVRWHVIRAD